MPVLVLILVRVHLVFMPVLVLILVRVHLVFVPVLVLFPVGIAFRTMGVATPAHGG